MLALLKAASGIAEGSARPLTANCHTKYHCGMVVTIDNAGRLVVPKPLREQFNLTPGCELRIEAAAAGITLRRADVEPTLVRKQGILVHHGAARDAGRRRVRPRRA